MTQLTEPEETHQNVRGYLEKHGYDIDGALAKLEEQGKVVREETVGSSTSEYGIPLLTISEPANERVAILIHGLDGTKLGTLPVAEMFLDMGYNVIAYDQPNSGDREPRINTLGVKESLDALDVLTYAEQQNPTGVVMWGTSYGGATTAYAAGQAEERLDAIILDSPMSNGLDMTRGVLEEIAAQNGISV